MEYALASGRKSGLIRRLLSEEILLSLIILATAGVSPNIFVAAQAGMANMKDLAIWLLIPAVAILLVSLLIAWGCGHVRLVNRVIAGAGAGLVATAGLEVIRLSSFHLGGMPGDLPRLMGVLLTDSFMQGSSHLSDFLGYAYHYWNGASFGIIFAVFLGRKSPAWGIVYGIVIGTVFLLSPPVQSLGIGFMGSDMPTMTLTVYIAHFVYGGILGWLCSHWVKNDEWLFAGNGSAGNKARSMTRTKCLMPVMAGILMLGVMMAEHGAKAAENINTAAITEQDIEYSPEEQTVHVGQSIRVENKDPFDHKSRVTRQLPGGALGEILSLGLMIPSALAGKDVGGMKRTEVTDHVDKPGTSFTFKLDKPGVYEIRCMLHDGMTATIKTVE